MKRKVCKRLLAGLLSGTMVLGMSVTAFAADETSGTTDGTGKFEGHVDKSVLSVNLPTIPDGSTPFAYTIDPEGLIAATQASKYPNTTYASETGVYFQTSTGNYTDKSAKLKITNKGSVDADVTVDVSVAAGSGITAMKAKDGFTDAGANELYLGLLVNSDAGIAVTDFGTDDGKKATKTVGLKGRPTNFEVKYNDTDDKYEYAAKSGVADTAWNSFEFGLEGACNKKGTYADGFAVPTVTVTWSYAAHDTSKTDIMLGENATEKAGPSIAITSYNYDRTATFDIVANFGAGDDAATAIKSVKIGADGKTFATDLTSSCEIDGSTITFPSGKLGTAAVGDKKYVQVSFDKGDPVVLTLTITK